VIFRPCISSVSGLNQTVPQPNYPLQYGTVNIISNEKVTGKANIKY